MTAISVRKLKNQNGSNIESDHGENVIIINIENGESEMLEKIAARRLPLKIMAKA